MEEDKDLDNIKSDDRYKTLIAMLKEKAIKNDTGKAKN